MNLQQAGDQKALVDRVNGACAKSRPFILCTLFLAAIFSAVISYFWQFGGNVILVQVFHTHGSKVPDIIEPRVKPYWAIWEAAGRLTRQGETEMHELGSFIRKKYVKEERFLSRAHVASHISVHASSHDEAPLQSAVAAFVGLYPDSDVPITKIDPDVDFLAPSLTKSCPSYFVEEEKLFEEYDEFLENSHEELLGNLRQITEFGKISPSEFVRHLGEKLESEFAHMYPMHPYLKDNADTLYPLAQQSFNLPLSRDINDPRGDYYQILGRKIAENIQLASQGKGPRLQWYSSHSAMLSGLRSLLGMDMTPWIDYGHAIVIETRQSVFASGLHVSAYSLKGVREGVCKRVTYLESPIRLDCQGDEQTCDLQSFLRHLRDRIGPTNGCCARTEGFFKLGCDNFLNQTTVLIPECKRWRELCPETACGNGQIVDKRTLECVRR